MPYSLKDIRASLPQEKRKTDGTMTRFLYRPVSVPVSWFFLRIGMTANGVTILSGALCIVAFVLTLIPLPAFHRVAIGLFLAFAVLDCADGNMARTIGKKTTYGGWVDAAGGYLAYATVLMSMGLSCFHGYGVSLSLSVFALSLPWTQATWILLGSLAAISNTLMRLFHQSLKNAEIAAGIPFAPGKEKRLSEEIGITGYLPILYLVGFETATLPFVFAAYAVIYAGGFGVYTLKALKKVSRYE